ncbi:auxin-responsive protein SAUR71-like [Cornus florida]|uniref:auxin-responsive protein SAUR71-like n=1 Tax=Cornus florida TaxID=4283 RepID=UPI00289BFBA7|nr:auxin-responsive protein SAUR71-like [Cornus florida]
MSLSSRMRVEWHKGIFRPCRETLHYIPKALTGKAGSRDPNEKLLMVGELSDGHQEKWRQVPKGSLAVYVGPELRRFVIPATYLSMPDFQELMEKVAEEFGYEQEGGLRIPCEEEDFEEILQRCLIRDQMISKSRRYQLMSKSRKKGLED